MPEFRAGSAEQIAYLEELVDARLLTPTGVHGVYARGDRFEAVRLGFDRLVTRNWPRTEPVTALKESIGRTPAVPQKSDQPFVDGHVAAEHALRLQCGLHWIQKHID